MPANTKNNTVPQPAAELDRRYGSIGISAVAAAVRYQSEPKNPAYAPAAMRPREETEDTVA